MASLPAGATLPLRSDAERNRRALVRAARAVFGERGLDAPLDEIARRAEVGNATLYRRFPTRCALLAAVFADTLEDVVAATERAIADPDPWSAFANHVTFLCELQATDRGLADLLTTTIRGVPALERLRKRAHDGFVRIADRAIDNGTLRADFRPEDIVLLLMAKRRTRPPHGRGRARRMAAVAQLHPRRTRHAGGRAGRTRPPATRPCRRR